MIVHIQRWSSHLGIVESLQSTTKDRVSPPKKEEYPQINTLYCYYYNNRY
jgi:hypothetical protein